jgi:O-antigen ligase
VFAGAISLTASANEHESVQAFRVVVVEPALFYLLASTSPGHQHVARDLALSLVLAGVLISVVGFWQYAFGDRIITAEADLRRIRGFYGSPNNLGLFLGRSIPFAVSFAVWPTRFRALAGVSAVLMAVALVLSFSIGAWVAVAGALVGIASLRGRPAIRGAIVLGAVVALLVAVSALTVPRIGSHFDFQSSTSSIRIDVWRSALRMIVDHPLRGIGLDNFLHYYQNGYRLPTAWQDPNLSHPHNVVLDFWLSLGLPGLVLLGALVGRYYVVARRAWSVASAADRALVAGSIGGVIDIILHGFVDNSFFLPDLAVLFWLMFVIVARVADRSGKSSTL